VRIVSLLPSATEIVCTLGLEEQLVGVTHECDYPPSVRRLPKVTESLIPLGVTSAEIDGLVVEKMHAHQALYTLDMATLEDLRPELIVTQTLCDVCAVAEGEVQAAVCALPGRPHVVNLEPTSLGEVLASVAQVAKAADVGERAPKVIEGLQRRIAAVAARSAALRDRPRTILLEWIDPPFSCGHWTPELVRLAGGVEGIGREGERSRRVGWDEILDWQPQALVIACCGFDVERTLRDLPILVAQPGWQELPCVRDGRVYVVDGSAYFSRPGPRLVDSLEILGNALHPEVHPEPRAGSALRMSPAVAGVNGAKR
jgi:iron complex transport system substrate-binding protein